jgi:hypothetical protein
MSLGKTTILQGLDVKGYPNKFRMAKEYAARFALIDSDRYWWKVRQTFVEYGGGFIADEY